MRRNWFFLGALLVSGTSCGGHGTSSPAPHPEDIALDTAPFVALEPPPSPPLPPGPPSAVRHAYSHARVDVRSDVARTVVTDVFVNDSDSEVKLSYRFPLPNDATIAGFADYRDGHRMEAVVGSRDDAQKEFERAEAAGKHAGLAEADGAMGFHLALSPMAAHESRRLELTYVQTLHPLGGERTLVYPAGYSGESPATAFELDVGVTAGHAIDSLECPNQREARVGRTSALTARASVERVAAPLEHDFVVRWSEAGDSLDLAARAVRTTGEEPAYVEARFSFMKDPYADAVPSRDVVFVVDTSLSMAGDALDSAKRVTERSLTNLSARDRVGLVTFDAEVRSWGALVPADDGAKKRLIAELSGVHAGGASNLDAAIDRAHALIQGSAHPVLVMATDGQPTVGEDLDRLTPATPPASFQSAKVFVALFNYPSRQKPLEALFPSVTSVYVPGGEAAEAAALRVASLAAAPTLEDLHLEVAGVAPDTQHGRIPATLAMGETVRVVGRATGPVSVRVTGTLHGKPIAMSQKVDLPTVPTDADPLPIEWARLRIADLESTYRETHDEKVKKEITTLGTTYHLVSSMTSLLATDDSLSPDRIMPGDPEIRVAAPRGASAVRAELPWGETVDCTWNDDEGLWFGRFLVPRSIADGLYRVRVFQEFQAETSLRTTLMFRVDSKPPEFKLRVKREGSSLRFEATPVRDVFDGHGSSIRKDLVDLKTLVVRFGGESVTLERADDDHWTALVPAADTTMRINAEVVATDFARNTSKSEVSVEVER